MKQVYMNVEEILIVNKWKTIYNLSEAIEPLFKTDIDSEQLEAQLQKEEDFQPNVWENLQKHFNFNLIRIHEPIARKSILYNNLDTKNSKKYAQVKISLMSLKRSISAETVTEKNSNEPNKYSNETSDNFIGNWFREKVDTNEKSISLETKEIAETLIFGEKDELYKDERVPEEFEIYLVKIGKNTNASPQMVQLLP
jgi:hypothetical protein